jgi:hypothetical protein
MSNTYKIHRWDSFLYNKDPVPIIYVKPDDALLKFAKENNNALLIRVSNSNSIYDGKKIAGVLYKSYEVTKCINFFNKTGLYVIVLESDWYGYPDSLGECDIFGLEGDVVVDPNTLLPVPTPVQPNSLKSLKSEKSDVNAGIIILVCVILIILIMLYKKK